MKKYFLILIFIASCSKTNTLPTDSSSNSNTITVLGPEMICGCTIGADSLTYIFLTCGCTITDQGATITKEIWEDYWNYNYYQLGGTDSLHAWVPWAMNFSDGVAQGVLSFTAIDSHGNSSTWVYP